MLNAICIVVYATKICHGDRSCTFVLHRFYHNKRVWYVEMDAIAPRPSVLVPCLASHIGLLWLHVFTLY